MAEPTSPRAALPVDDDLVPGTLIGDRYRVLARLGVGGMGTVYRAEHVLMKKEVALKVLRRDLGAMEDAVRRFEREAQSASRLSHPNIIAVTDFGRAASGELFLVMELIRGESLGEVLDREGRLALPRAIAIIRQILLGLEHAHAQGVVHRDLKPANIMITTPPDGSESADEVPKILDFGIAKMSQGVPEGARPLTQGTMVFGTPSYMSPEQATAGDIDARSDLYSCGVILFELLTGRAPFVADDTVKLMAMQVTSPAPSFAEVAPELRLPPALEAVARRALDKDKARRYQSARAMREALDAAAQGAVVVLVKGLPAKLRRARARLAPIVAAFHRRVPSPVRRGLLVAGALILLSWITVPLLRRDAGAPATPPPAPKAIAPPLVAPLQRIQDAIARGDLGPARVLLLQEISARPEEARLHYLLGHISFAEKKVGEAMAAYDQALSLDPGLRGDAALLLNVKAALADRAAADAALKLLIGRIGQPAGDVLAEVASQDRRGAFRRQARAACDDVGCGDKVDRVRSYALDLEQGKTCDEKRQAVRALAATGDERAIPALRRARGGRGVVDRIFGGANACIQKDLAEALKKLGAT